MPRETINKASAPFSTSSLPTWGPTNSTRRTSAEASSWRSAAITVSDNWALDISGLTGSRIRTSRDVPKFCTLASVIPSFARSGPYSYDVSRLGISNFHYGSASEIDAQIQPLGYEKKYRHEKSHQRYGGGIFPPAHEGDVVLDSKKFHTYLYLPKRCTSPLPGMIPQLKSVNK